MPDMAQLDERTTDPVLLSVDAEGDPLDLFESEGDAGPKVDEPQGQPVGPDKPRLMAGAVALVGIAVATAVAGGCFYLRVPVSAPPAVRALPSSGHASLNSRPDGAVVLIDGVVRGTTPLELDLNPGVHDVLFRTDSGERRLALTVESGARLSENVDMPAAAPLFGSVEVTSEPSGASISLDGSAMGKTPLELSDIAVGRHVVDVSQGPTVVSRTVEVAPGGAVSLFVSLATPASGAMGTFAVDSPLDFQLLENGKLLGSSNAAPLSLSPGEHKIELVNDALELRLTKVVTVDSGKTTRISVPSPSGNLFVNAFPWAEVFVDGRDVGSTPLGNVPVAVGAREIVWRHPELGERRQTIVVGAQTPVRVAVDMSR